MLIPPSQAAKVPDAVCARYDHGIRTGICLRDGHGGLFWLGTFRGYDGAEVYCIDYLYATDWGVAHDRRIVAGRLPTSVRGSVDPATVATLTAVVTRNPADRVGDTTAAAIGLLIREVMGDVRAGGGPIPGGLTAARNVGSVGFVPASVLRRARELWAQARAQRGPWSLTAVIDPGPDRKVTTGERVRMTLRGRSGSGVAQDMRVALSYHGFSGPAAVSLGSDSQAVLTVTAPRSPTTGSITARVGDAPSPSPVLIQPRGWRTNPRPGHVFSMTQRGFLGRQAAVTASTSASAVIVKAAPTLATRTSAQVLEPGAAVHDTVAVARTSGAAGSFTWTLLGPVQPGADGTCPAGGEAAWAGAAVRASGVVATRGDRTYRTPSYVVRPEDVGCLSYAEVMPETSTTLAASSPPGAPDETVLVRRSISTPCVTTAATRQRGLVGVRLADRIKIGCIAASDRLDIAWVARGPVEPHRGGDRRGCARIATGTWNAAPVAARGTIVATGPGMVLTTPVTVRRPGCYTFSESMAATATTRATRILPGVVAETSLITRPPVPVVPVVPTGPYRASHGWWLRGVLALLADLTPGASHRVEHGHLRPAGIRRPGVGDLRVPSLGIDAPIQSVPMRGGVLEVPSSPFTLGWLRSTARPDDVVGSTVLAGHVSDRDDRPGPLAMLHRARIGTTVVWRDARGRSRRFVVVSLARYPRATGLPASLFRTDGPHRLVLITCAHRVALPGGGFHYTHNLVVTMRATP